jgi:hypothetical protein
VREHDGLDVIMATYRRVELSMGPGCLSDLARSSSFQGLDWTGLGWVNQEEGNLDMSSLVLVSQAWTRQTDCFLYLFVWVVGYSPSRGVVVFSGCLASLLGSRLSSSSS